jgi:hypothetical protein
MTWLARTIHPPSSRGVIRACPPGDGDLVYCGRALPRWFSGGGSRECISILPRSSPALHLYPSYPRAPLFSFSVCLSTLSFPPWSSCARSLVSCCAASEKFRIRAELTWWKDDFYSQRSRNVYLVSETLKFHQSIL